VSQHQIGVFGGLELGMLAEFVHHLVSGAQDFQIGQHNSLHGSLFRRAGVRDGIVGFPFQPERRPCPPAGALTICATRTPAVLSELLPLTELAHETIPSETARP
jgi:hypothetical protein